MNLIQFLAMKLHHGPVFIDGLVNSTEIVVHSKANFVKVIQNQLLFQKPLMLRANWYRKIVMWPIDEIETTLDIIGTSVHSIFLEHLTVKKICSRWLSHNLSIAQKKAHVNWSKEILQKNDLGASKHVYDIVTGDESDKAGKYIHHGFSILKITRIQSQLTTCIFSRSRQAQNFLKFLSNITSLFLFTESTAIVGNLIILEPVR